MQRMALWRGVVRLSRARVRRAMAVWERWGWIPS